MQLKKVDSLWLGLHFLAALVGDALFIFNDLLAYIYSVLEQLAKVGALYFLVKD
jgi:hypothetical protein